MESSTKRNFPEHIWAIAVASAVVVIWLLSWFLLRHEPERGTFGDMFGGTNALFSGLAFAGVIYAILLQKQELKLQRKELELTRQELSRSAEAQEKSVKELNEHAKILKLSAKLNSLNSLIAACNEDIKIYSTLVEEMKERLSGEAKQPYAEQEKLRGEVNIDRLRKERNGYLNQIRSFLE